ncbi:MAG: 4Fe-4S binding protein [Methanomassiliicoccaceae archaeon]|nr:4Fe-4S binding protein [Methanomassiliicoccaceae archaeon]
MKRQVISIDRDRCIGCGACVNACHQGAVELVGGKAKLVREDHCDGLGNCLPKCPAGAISFVLKDVYEAKKSSDIPLMTHECACSEEVKRKRGEMARWPLQISLVSLKAPFFAGADLLVATDCTAFVSKDFHKEMIKDRVVVIGCPKLDRDDYQGRIAEIIRSNDIRSVTLARMEVPCCAAMERTVKDALTDSGKNIPFSVTVISTEGNVIC